MTFVSYAQNFEDVILWRALREINQGFYIDVGAADPDTESVTRAFHDRGWRGINIEPLPEQHRRLQAARVRDINLAVAVSDLAGMAELHVGGDPGLATLNRELAAGFPADLRLRVEVMTLADICRRYAPADIHFLKIDAEGSERAVLAGADFRRYRPWVVLVEATEPCTQTPNHAGWDGILIEQDYHFVWFDGLNRFYVAAEHHQRLARCFTTPPNVFDDFVRAADSEWSRRLADTAGETRALRARLQDAASQLAAAAAARETLRQDAIQHADRQQAALQRQSGRLDSTERRLAMLLDMLGAKQAELDTANDWLRAMRASTCWRVTAPLRAIGGLRRRTTSEAHTGNAPRFERDAGLRLPDPDSVAPPKTPPRRGAHTGVVRTVHQFHSGSAMGDAITQSMLLIRGLLRGMGLVSDVFVQHRDPALARELRTIDELPGHADYVLIVHHSMGHTALDRIAALPATKILLYHNITPPEFLNRAPALKHFARVGRDQLDQLRHHVVAALADSDYNAIELRRLGYEAVWACPLLFDIDAVRARAASKPTSRGSGVFTILFVGRVTESKAQDELIEAYAQFRNRFAAPSRLVLVGRPDDSAALYLAAIDRLIARADLADHVVRTGMVDDHTLDAWYKAADLYVSLSHHEGFGVPLVEAMAHGVPVLAWPSGAVPYTLDGAAELLSDRAPARVAEQMVALAANPHRRAVQAQRQISRLDRFRLERQLPVLRHVLGLAGAVPPKASPFEALSGALDAVTTRATLAANLRFTLTGHVNGSYSLAAINRSLALSLAAARPGSVRLLPVEGTPTTDLSGVPAASLPKLAALAARAPHDSGPELVISQHYPVYRPEHRGDVRTALFFWEESVIPAETIAGLNRDFDGVLAPSSFVARALIDSGLAVPVRQITHLPDLGAMQDVAHRRARAAKSPQPFVFLHVSSAFPRKGVDVLLEAYARGFDRDDPVRLVIKSFPNPHNQVGAQIADLRRRYPAVADIEWIDRDLSDTDLQALYTEADAMVLPSRGEGLNLPAAEALAAGLPLIVTGFGGQLDFCSPDNAVLVDYQLTPSGSHLATPHSLWADPNVDDLVAALQRAIDDPDATRRAQRGAATIRRLADPAMTLSSITDAALDLLLTPPAPPPRIAVVSTWRKRCGVAEYARHLLDTLTDPTAGDASQASRVTILCDLDTAPAALFDDGLCYRPTWRIGLPDGITPLASAISAEAPEIVLLQHQPGLFSWQRLAELLDDRCMDGRIVVVVLHNTRHLFEATASVQARTLRALAACARVIVHTIDDINRLHQHGLRDNVTLLPHGVANRAALTPPMPQADDTGPIIGCYGFFLPDKGLPQLIGAIAHLRDSWPGIRLRLVNAEYPAAVSAREIAYCRAIADELGLEIEWHTDFLADDESVQLLAGCDIIVLPYQRSLEASSAAMRTALSAGVPVAVTPLPLFDEAGHAVIRLPGIDRTAIADGISDLLRDADRQARARDAARQWLGARSWSHIGTRLFGMLNGLHRTALCDATRLMSAPSDDSMAKPAAEIVEFAGLNRVPAMTV